MTSVSAGAAARLETTAFHRAARYADRPVTPGGTGRLFERGLVLEAKAHPEACGRLVETFMPLIGSVARIYRRSPAVDRRELMQEGVVGLLRALERYDARMDTPFWAYAYWWVRQAMQELVSQLTRPVVLSDRAVRQLARVKDAQQTFLRTHGVEAAPSDLAAETGLSAAHVESLLAADRRPRAVEERIGGADDNASGGTIGEQIADPMAQDAFDEVSTALEPDELPGLLEDLSEREQVILCARFGLGGPEQTLREVGEHLGVSVERVRQIEERALGKLRDALGAPA
ncbi:MAG: polymerase primary sigma factor [Gaiellales bacterium]|nr:polymerase primary sigma factor [Gaiellales bacterium]